MFGAPQYVQNLTEAWVGGGGGGGGIDAGTTGCGFFFCEPEMTAIMITITITMMPTTSRLSKLSPMSDVFVLEVGGATEG